MLTDLAEGWCGLAPLEGAAGHEADVAGAPLRQILEVQGRALLAHRLDRRRQAVLAGGRRHRGGQVLTFHSGCNRQVTSHQSL